MAALNGLKEIDCGVGKKCLVFTKDFEIEKPSNPNISEPNYPNNVVVSKPSQNTDYIPNTEDIINEKVVLDENDLYKDIIINEIIADLKDKYYTIDIADLKAILEAYKNLDKNSAEARTKFIMDYFFDKNNKDNPSMEIAQKEIFQSLDFLLAYQDNGLDKAGDDKFANKEAIQAKNDILTEVSNALENKTITNNLEKLNNLNDKINSANNDFKEKNYYKQLNDLALAYNKYIELINKGLASKDDQAFKDISNKLFALIAQVGKETEAIEKLIKDFEGLKIQASEKSNGHFIVEGELSAIKIPYPILASIKDNNNNNGGGEIDKPEKPIDPIEPPIDNKPDNTDNSLVFKQSSTFNSIGDEAIDDEEEKEIGETDGEQRLITCIVSDNFKTMNPCAVGH
ncbi:hypothetical protein IEJ30_001512 [Campylobacter lari]|nr:hypothetical protein [Campylobacter lari]